jgi:hypothetical protein
MIAIELCADCVYVDANGETFDSLISWPGFREEWAGWVFGPAVLDYACESTCGACDLCAKAYEQHGEGHFVRPGSACDGCGSTLGGQRWDYVAVEVEPRRCGCGYRLDGYAPTESVCGACLQEIKG